MTQNALIVEILRNRTDHGPGTRTTVLFKGCPLRCGWCKAPEALSPRIQVQWVDSRCLGCHTCIRTCPNGALALSDGRGIRRDSHRCRRCGRCAEACPTTAMQALGTSWSIQRLVKELTGDQSTFARTSGGVTLSGGEPTVQADAAHALLARLQELGIHTALDTCGQCNTEVLGRLLPVTDLVLYDIRHMDPQIHRTLTGLSNERNLAGARFIGTQIRRQAPETEWWIRTPLVPGATATAENIRSIGRFIAQELKGSPTRWELCEFDDRCQDRYASLGMRWQYEGYRRLTSEQLSKLAAHAKESGVAPSIVHTVPVDAAGTAAYTICKGARRED